MFRLSYFFLVGIFFFSFLFLARAQTIQPTDKKIGCFSISCEEFKKDYLPKILEALDKGYERLKKFVDEYKNTVPDKQGFVDKIRAVLYEKFAISKPFVTSQDKEKALMVEEIIAFIKVRTNNFKDFDKLSQLLKQNIDTIFLNVIDQYKKCLENRLSGYCDQNGFVDQKDTTKKIYLDTTLRFLADEVSKAGALEADLQALADEVLKDTEGFLEGVVAVALKDSLISNLGLNMKSIANKRKDILSNINEINNQESSNLFFLFTNSIFKADINVLKTYLNQVDGDLTKLNDLLNQLDVIIKDKENKCDIKRVIQIKNDIKKALVNLDKNLGILAKHINNMMQKARSSPLDLSSQKLLTFFSGIPQKLGDAQKELKKQIANGELIQDKDISDVCSKIDLTDTFTAKMDGLVIKQEKLDAILRKYCSKPVQNQNPTINPSSDAERKRMEEQLRKEAEEAIRRAREALENAQIIQGVSGTPQPYRRNRPMITVNP